MVLCFRAVVLVDRIVCHDPAISRPTARRSRTGVKSFCPLYPGYKRAHTVGKRLALRLLHLSPTTSDKTGAGFVVASSILEPRSRNERSLCNHRDWIIVFGSIKKQIDTRHLELQHFHSLAIPPRASQIRSKPKLEIFNCQQLVIPFGRVPSPFSLP